MPDVIASQIDIAIYLVPGYLVLLAVVFAYAPDRLRASREKLGGGEIVASVIAALLLGIVLHRVAAVVPLASRVINREQMLAGIVGRFEHTDRVRTKVEQKLGFAPREAIDAYYYGRVLIDENAPATAQAAERLTNLSLLCRNMMVAIPIATAMVMWPLRSSAKRRLYFGSGVLAAVILEALFLQGFRAYWSAAVWRILRAILVMT